MPNESKSSKKETNKNNVNSVFILNTHELVVWCANMCFPTTSVTFGQWRHMGERSEDDSKGLSLTISEHYDLFFIFFPIENDELIITNRRLNLECAY